MKKTLLTLALAAVTVASFAQGKVSLVNDSLHLVYFTSVRAGDEALLNNGPTSALTPSGVQLRVDLYAGSSAGSLSFVSSTLFGATPGRFGPATIVLPTIAGAPPFFFQVQIRDNAFATASLAAAGGSYSGVSSIFNTTPGTSITPNSIVAHGAPANSTWTDGTFALSQYGVGAMGAIGIGLVPEPSSMALAGLGAASLLLFRRRK